MRKSTRLEPLAAGVATAILLAFVALPMLAIFLEVPVGTVKSRLFRARRLLQQQLYEYAVGMGYIKGSAK